MAIEIPWTEMIAGFVAVFLGWMQFKLKSALAEQTVLAKSTHTLVNSQMQDQLNLYTAMAKRVALLTNDPVDHEIAALAAKKSTSHTTKQKDADAK